MPVEPALPYHVSSPSSVSSFSSDESADDDVFKDPYLLTLHFVTDPGQSSELKGKIEPLVKWYDPNFKLFNIAERSRTNKVEHTHLYPGDIVPALAVVLFMQISEEEDENRVIEAQTYLSKDPWKFHHSADVSGNLFVCEPNFQTFYSVEQEMPLWAVRQVHYGREHLRFMVFSSKRKWKDMIQFYSLVLGRKVEYQRNDFCYFVVHIRENFDVQFAIKKVPDECVVRPLNSAFLQIKVREAGELVPLLPNACSPISPQRWQTTDPDGNVLLLLVSRRAVALLSKTSTQRTSLDSVITPKAFKSKAGRTLRRSADKGEPLQIL